jgi:ribosome recycling factor
MNKQKISLEMDKVVDIFRDEIATIRTGRANPSLIEDLEVMVYGGEQKMKIKELGTVGVEEARAMVFQPWDKSIIKEIKNEILANASDLQAVVDGEKIRIKLPTMTSEQRENYLALLNKKLEAARVMVRNIRADNRHDFQEMLQNDQLSEDEFHQWETELQKLTDEYIGILEKLAEKKREEIQGNV